jgi:hypothetical protein
MTLNSFRINYRFVTYSGKISAIPESDEPFTSGVCYFLVLVTDPFVTTFADYTP